ncbi:hypothetical protein GE061_004232 [Apolygus lucorum]|uniref:Uncharacterized protein n=1 Tax=Apolygus lucorum TaxID=248454 RepID=A0A8S9WYQ2_APOLU|nr:hypothetical protein GE061_004232 [Apolygus lucorum]
MLFSGSFIRTSFHSFHLLPEKDLEVGGLHASTAARKQECLSRTPSKKSLTLLPCEVQFQHPRAKSS